MSSDIFQSKSMRTQTISVSRKHFKSVFMDLYIINPSIQFLSVSCFDCIEKT